MFSPSSGFFRKSVAISGNKRSFKVMSGSSVSPFRYAIDTLKYSAIFNTGLGVTLEAVTQHNVDKLKKRYPEGFDPDRSVHRPEYEGGAAHE